jgi:putative Holliday junction resolvase
LRILCIDLGDKRSGLAVGDTETRIASPLEIVELPMKTGAPGAPGDALVNALAFTAQEQGATAPVIGLPLNMDDTEGPRAKLVRDFGARVARRTGLPVHYQDERLTTADADWSMARSGLTRGQKKNRRDALAAAAILRDYLESLP